MRAQNLATASLITAGVAGVGSLAGLLFWRKAALRPEAAFAVTPLVTRDAVAVTLRTAY